MQKRICIFTAAFAVLAAASATARSPFISKVYEYSPAPGQFVNELPEYSPGDDAAAMAAKATENIAGDRTPGMISLGAYGGYVIFGFDHPVVNLHGRYDFRIYGNAMPAPGASAEPGVVSVSVDTNGNGIPDDTWYELAGSARKLSATRHAAEAVYRRPDPGKAPVPDPSSKPVLDTEYIPYTLFEAPDAEPRYGWIQKVQFHTQSYWPEWLGDEIRVSGTLLPDNGIDVNGDGRNWITTPMHWGYADNLPNDAYKGFSIDWAVDADGNPVVLERVDFIKVHTGVLQNLGWTGESSTEICGGEDLHPDAVYSPEWPADPIDPAKEYGMPDELINGVAPVLPAGHSAIRIYDLQGALRLADARTGDINSLPAGIYIEISDRGTRKIMVR